MTGDPGGVTFRTLLVEDDAHTREFLAGRIEKRISPIIIDMAERVPEAMDFIETRREQGVCYDLAILDFVLPTESEGDQKDVDVSLSQLFREHEVPVIHITGWPHDQKIKKYMEEVYQQDMEEILSGSRVKLIAKTVTREWVDELVKLIKRHHQKVISTTVRQRIEAVLGEDTGADEEVGHALRHEFPGTGIGCGTHALLQLQDDIVNTWAALEPKLKDEIQTLFAVCDLDGKKKRLSLFPPEDR